MHTLDYVVLGVYFLVMMSIGLWSMLKVKKQEDFFLGSRVFGKLFQAFAAFGAGTGSHDPVTVGRTTYTSGLSGIWSVLLWLFVTPFYWFTAVWYRRMRHITLGDWFVERYQSKGLGVAFMLFGVAFYMVYLGLGFTAIGKVGAPLVDVEQLSLLGFTIPIEHALVYLCALIVLFYGVLGGLRAAYWTDVIQGFFIIALSVLLIPAGLSALVQMKKAEEALQPPEVGMVSMVDMADGFEIMHERVPDEYFELINTPTKGGEFPLYYIVGITLLNLVAIVVHPHMAVTGGGTAKTENSARVGLVVGNFLKRFCTIGWCITILIVLAYMAKNTEIARDPDRVWGVAARELLGPYNIGLVGLMLACLMAALMSSASAYMLIVSALVIRNFYAAYLNSEASEKTYIFLGRVVSAAVIVGGVAVSIYFMDVLEQLKIAWEMPILFAAPFWIGMFWRRATKWAAWGTFLFVAAAFFIGPIVVPWFMPQLADDTRFLDTNEIVQTTVTRKAAKSDVDLRAVTIPLWEQGDAIRREIENLPRDENGKILEKDQPAFKKLQKDLKKFEVVLAKHKQCPTPLALGDQTRETFTTGGKPIYWKNAVWFDDEGKPHEIVDGKGNFRPVDKKYQDQVLEELSRDQQDNILIIRQRYKCPLQGRGSFSFDYLAYGLGGLDLRKMSKPALETLRLPTRIALPFIVMILLSLITPRVDKEKLDRFYVKMKTPVEPDPEADKLELDYSYQAPQRFDDKRLFRFFGLEIQRPKFSDLVAFVFCFLICFGLIWLTVWLANFGR